LILWVWRRTVQGVSHQNYRIAASRYGLGII
jgi:hypothetical protein